SDCSSDVCSADLPAIALSREAALAKEQWSCTKNRAAFPRAGTAIHRALTSVTRAAPGCQCNVLVAARSTAATQTSAAVAGLVWATRNERTPLLPARQQLRRTACLRPSRT